LHVGQYLTRTLYTTYLNTWARYFRESTPHIRANLQISGHRYPRVLLGRGPSRIRRIQVQVPGQNPRISHGSRQHATNDDHGQIGSYDDQNLAPCGLILPPIDTCRGEPDCSETEYESETCEKGPGGVTACEESSVEEESIPGGMQLVATNETHRFLLAKWGVGEGWYRGWWGRYKRRNG
jgi:hypothetical protein